MEHSWAVKQCSVRFSASPLLTTAALLKIWNSVQNILLPFLDKYITHANSGHLQETPSSKLSRLLVEELHSECLVWTSVLERNVVWNMLWPQAVFLFRICNSCVCLGTYSGRWYCYPELDFGAGVREKGMFFFFFSHALALSAWRQKSQTEEPIYCCQAHGKKRFCAALLSSLCGLGFLLCQPHKTDCFTEVVWKDKSRKWERRKEKNCVIETSENCGRILCAPCFPQCQIKRFAGHKTTDKCLLVSTTRQRQTENRAGMLLRLCKNTFRTLVLNWQAPKGRNSTRLMTP